MRVIWQGFLVAAQGGMDNELAETEFHFNECPRYCWLLYL